MDASNQDASFCGHCGAAMVASDRFCGACGRWRDEATRPIPQSSSQDEDPLVRWTTGQVNLPPVPEKPSEASRWPKGWPSKEEQQGSPGRGQGPSPTSSLDRAFAIQAESPAKQVNVKRVLTIVGTAVVLLVVIAFTVKAVWYPSPQVKQWAELEAGNCLSEAQAEPVKVRCGQPHLYQVMFTVSSAATSEEAYADEQNCQTQVGQAALDNEKDNPQYVVYRFAEGSSDTTFVEEVAGYCLATFAEEITGSLHPDDYNSE